MSQDHEPGNGATDNPEGAPVRASSSVDADIDFRTAQAERQGRRRAVRRRRDLTKGSIPKNLWFLAWPQIVESFLSVVDQLADLVWAGRLGFQAIAGLGVAQTFLMMTMTARMGLDAGMRSMISRAVGAKNIAYANHVMLQALTLTTIYSLIVVTLGVVLTYPLLRLMGLSDDVVSAAGPYMRVQFLAMAVMGYQRLTAGALQASGDSMTPLRAATVTRVTHVVLSPFLIFGLLWFPTFGLAGAAIANLIAQVLGVTLNFRALLSGASRLHLTFRGYYVDYQLIWRVVKIGVPASVTGAQRAISQLIVISLVASFGDVALAAYALSRRAENTVNHASRGLGRAAGALAGQNLGADLPDRAKQSVLWAVIYSSVASLSIAAVFLIFPKPVASLFNSDAEFVRQAALWLQILAIGYFSMNTVQVFTQSFNTTGATFAPMVVTVSTMWAVELPLAFYLSQYTSLEEYGIPWAIVVGMTLRLFIFTWYYLQGKWLRTGTI
ncbi:MAG: MATE family efflux transporter [Chloroflexi bacterium]|nr:MATE family efflux transporter [Chloroflexota bacterium]